jgi:hypothetical protein
MSPSNLPYYSPFHSCSLSISFSFLSCVQQNTFLGTAQVTPLDMIFSVPHYFKVHKAIYPFTTDVIFFNQVQMVMFYNVQTTNLTFINKL